MGSCQYVILAAVAILGAALIIIGGVLIPFFNQQLRESLEPRNKTEQFDAWLNWTRYKPVYQEFYFFNITNPEVVQRTALNTTVNQIGPYVYRVHLERRNVSSNTKDTRLSFDLYKSYTFERNMSVGDEGDQMTLVNLPILNMATRLITYPKDVKMKVAKEVSRFKENLFTQVNVSDVLWGYKNPTLTSVEKLLEGYFGIHLLNDTTYGLMYQSGQPRATRSLKTFKISTGVDDLSSLWNVVEWNGNSSLNIWRNTNCNMINGTDGYSWPPGVVDQSRNAYIFDSEWCRSIPLNYQESTWIGRLKTFKYSFDKNAFRYMVGTNKGFCQPTPQKQSCLYTGVFNVTKCKDNVPLLLSQPHLLGAAKSYRRAIRGINPDKMKHSTTFNIEPKTGMLIEASRKMQLNAYVMSLKSFPAAKKFNKNHTIIPVVWMNEIYSMTEKERDGLLNRQMIYDGVQYGLIALGAVLIICALIGFIVVCLRNKRDLNGERQPLLSQQ